VAGVVTTWAPGRFTLTPAGTDQMSAFIPPPLPVRISMHQHGVTNLIEMAGGLAAWEAAKLPVSREV